MMKNLHLKIAALLLATIFWMVIVSLENTFYQFPGEVPIQVFNQAQNLALASKLGTVHLAIRAQDPVLVHTLSTKDFEAYVDLRNVGEGVRRVPVLVTSKNPQVSVLRIDPSELDITLEPVREKLLALKLVVSGEPAKGFRLESSKLSQNTVTVSGAESWLKNIGEVRALVALTGTENEHETKDAVIKIYDRLGVEISGLKIKDQNVSVDLNIIETSSTKDVGVHANFVGAIANGSIKKIEVEPGVMSVAGSRDALEKVEVIETEPIELKDVPASAQSYEKTVKVLLQQGVSVVAGGKAEVKVKLEIERN